MITKELLIQAHDALQHAVMSSGGETGCDHELSICFCKELDAITALQAAIDQPEPELEPVATIHVNHINGESSAILFNRRTLHHGDLLYTHPAPAKPLTELARMKIIGEEFPLALVEPIVIQKIDSVCRNQNPVLGIAEHVDNFR